MYRHSGMDCRNPGAKKGIHADWMPSLPDGMTVIAWFSIDEMSTGPNETLKS
ncbi:hypothetical protein [Methyloglobulus sp.]|uniref:hypothetical protein n=1 Tax=Methyloglobulus sp. TaxID=2518622 RepID=UPI00398A0560